MEKQINMHRCEVKFHINKLQAAELSFILRKDMFRDVHSADTGSYWVRSLYFDTVDNRDYYEKVIGHNTRRKIRLRIYDISAGQVKLELKNKYCSRIHKETVLITREDANKLISGDCEPLLGYKEKAADKIFVLMRRAFYRPTVIIDYAREAYLYPFQNIRVTIDANFCANYSHCSYDLFNRDMCMIPVSDSYTSILEIKYDHMLPPFLQKVLSGFDLYRTQISKYCMARNMLGK
jgi:hypothetical protein